ncbi:MAG: short-chain dehydrogenase [Bacteroidetes bacterium MedPE-SWsnd-G2]|nr:MAG: short-chain dehydrogenase [Bacteroidetes bacterium MedPE-SWsnd-G2]
MRKTIIVTGSTDGIGKLAAMRLAKDEHEVYIHGRNASKVEKVVSEIKIESGNNHIYGLVADFSNLNTVEDLSNSLLKKLKKIDVLINNAGVFKTPVHFNSDGLDMRFAVNFIAPFVFTERLLPLLRNGNQTRIINLSSAAQATILMEALKGKVRLTENDSYAQSKLALTMWSFNLAKTQNFCHVIAVNPGSLLNTNMVKEAYGHHWSSADKGANILYELAVSDAYKNRNGEYFDNDKGEVKGEFSQAHPDAYNALKIDELMSYMHNQYL